MTYKITNIEYGIGPWGTEMLYGAEIGNPAPGQTENNIHSFTYLEGHGHKILVDTGIDTDDEAKDKLWKSFGQSINGTTKGLEVAGLTYEDIDAIIITHVRIDRIGAIGRSRFWGRRRRAPLWRAKPSPNSHWERWARSIPRRRRWSRSVSSALRCSLFSPKARSRIMLRRCSSVATMVSRT